MNAVFLARLGLDVVAGSLLVFGLAYWWLGNAPHEIAGTAMFALLILHNVFNRRFYASLAKTRREARSAFNMALTAVLLVAMVVLLVTSVLISQTLSPYLSAYGGFTVRQLHTLAAYWALVLVAVHLGLRWPVIMDVARSLCRIRRPTAMRTWGLRLVALTIALCGIWSSGQLDIGTRLTMQVTLDWWNFEEAVVPFFLHCLAIVGLYITVTYYAMKWLRRRPLRLDGRDASPQRSR